MDFPQDQIDELKRLFGEVLSCNESGFIYFFIPALSLPEGCSHEKVDVLLCPMPRDGYNSRLFFAEKIQSKKPQNWNVNGIRIIERNWYAFSWRTPENLRLATMVAMHLKGLQ
jgi:hypothetical protein